LPPGILDDWLEALFGNLLAQEPPARTWLFILDQTYVGHQSRRMHNTFSTAHRGRRQQHPCRHRRHKKKAQHQRYCHCLVCGLLITPSGVRLPVWRPYYTPAYAAQHGRPYRKQTELAADLIDALRVPVGAEVVVLGDAAFDADVVWAACRRRHFLFIVSMNHDRRLAGPKPRPRVTARAADWTANDYVPVRLTPGTGRYVAQRRAAACRTGLRRKTRVFWVHDETLEVFHVGTARVLYSTMHPPPAGQPVTVQKVLLSNDHQRPVTELIELYDLRWQIELFFKECKSTLGLARYRFEDFRCVVGWVNLCLLAFRYLEWYRLQKLRGSAGQAAEQKRWQWQRSHGLSQAVRQDVEREDVRALLAMLEEPEGSRRVLALLRQAVQKEYRQAG
jgi:hypothetical protein